MSGVSALSARLCELMIALRSAEEHDLTATVCSAFACVIAIEVFD
jgi:hypothetical protein